MATSSHPAELTPRQLHALFDVLSHHETYSEIESFKSSQAVRDYGFPFTRTQPAATSTSGTPSAGTPRARTPVPLDLTDEDDPTPSATPVLQTLLTRFVLPLPGVKNLPREFWAVQIQGILARLGDADLSESYDKGALGLRKTLATGAGAVIEMLGRGAFGGVPKTEKKGDAVRTYDSENADDIEEAWEDIMYGLVYGDLVDEVCKHAAETDDLEALSPAAKAAAEYAIVHLATFAHHVFITAPEGQYLLRLMENAHGLIPYKMLKQTLRVGNAATMISGMMRLLLAKLSVASLTNWVGLTNNSDDGMNLLQRIISMTLSWDSSEFKKGADKLEKERQGDDSLRLIRDFVAQGKADHLSVREESMEKNKSIITAILQGKDQEKAVGLTEEDHAAYLQYYSALLSVRDRDAITAVLCRQPPDLFTQMVRDVIAAYDPIIRDVHSNVDLRLHLEAGQVFIDDFIKASKPKDDGRVASVGDYVELLMKNRGLMYRWVHHLAGMCPDVWEQFRTWAGQTFGLFREGQVKHRLGQLYSELPGEKRAVVGEALDAHADYLEKLQAISKARLQQILSAKASSSEDPTPGPGMYLSRWQDLLDETPITPAQPVGPVRHGKDVKGAMTMGKTTDTVGEDVRRKVEEEEPQAPDVTVVVEELAQGFKGLLQDLGGSKSSS